MNDHDLLIGDIVLSSSGKRYRVQAIGDLFVRATRCNERGFRLPGRAGIVRSLMRPVEIVDRSQRPPVARP